MNLQHIRWPVMIATMAVTLAALFGAGFVLKTQTVEEPLRAMYAKSPALESATVERQGEKYVIRATFKDVPDFATTYGQLYTDTAKLLKETPFTIEVADRRSPELEKTFRRVNLYVQEALATGQFANMADRVEAEAAKAGLTAQMAVDNNHVFVQLHGKDGYLYSVAERTQQPVKETHAEGGIGL